MADFHGERSDEVYRKSMEALLAMQRQIEQQQAAARAAETAAAARQAQNNKK